MQKFVGVCTWRLKRNVVNGGTLRSIVVNIVVGEYSRKIRNICVRREILVTTEGESSNSQLEKSIEWTTRYLCLSHANWSGCGMIDSTCWYGESLKRNEWFVRKIDGILCCGEDEDDILYYEESLTYDEEEVDGVAQLKWSSSGSQSTEATNDGGSEEWLIPIERDDLKKEDLLKRGSSVSKRWSL